MKAIISHQNIDFDGLASMVACSKLYPDAALYFTGKVSEEVKRFMALYKNVLTIPQAGKLDLSQITELHIVDVDQEKRIGSFKQLVGTGIPITVWDHHPPQEESIKEAVKIHRSYGACTTILIEQLREKQISLSAFEATLLALGIYSDTGCLTYSHTVYQDAEAVAFLLRSGAQLPLMNEFLKDSLEPAQNQLLTELLSRSETVEINGYEIVITSLEKEDYIPDLAILADKILRLKGCQALFLFLAYQDRIDVIGRSQEEAINIPQVLSPFKGKGHHLAASAAVRGTTLPLVRAQLLAQLETAIKPQPRAREIMSYPVKTVQEGMTVEEVSGVMLRYGHTGIPVVKDHELIGIISRTDVDKAMIHHLGHAPVKAFMTRHVITISPDTSLSEISDLLIRHNIGRLPVVEKGKMIGIVTRTEVLKVLHGASHPTWYRRTYQERVQEPLDRLPLKELLPQDIYGILKTAGSIGDQLESKVFVVGGFVRDLLSERENWDIDIVLEGDGIDFAGRLAQQLKGVVKPFPQFGTAVIQLENGQTLDIVTARREYYEYPAALPKVEKSSIWSDLFRRDFTINCMALQLNQAEEGKLIDYFGGLADLKDKKLRVLYNLSFIEDPTRIFRAIRFASRLGFEIEEETGFFMTQALQNGMLKNLSDDRIREELFQILKEPALLDSLQALEQYGVLKGFHPQLKLSPAFRKKLAQLEEGIQRFSQLYQESFQREMIVIMLLLSRLSLSVREAVLNKFVSPGEWRRRMEEGWSRREEIDRVLSQEEVDRVTLYHQLHGLNPHLLLYLYLETDSANVRHYLMVYCLKLKAIHLEIGGRDLMALQIPPGPLYKQILDQVLAEKIKGALYNKEAELRFARQVYESLTQQMTTERGEQT